MVAFLTTRPLINGLVQSWQRFSHVSPFLNHANEESIAFVPDIKSVQPKNDDLLSRRMRALGFDMTEAARFRPDIVLDLQKICLGCDSRTQCDADLKTVSAEAYSSDAETWRDYCPNVATLKMLSSLLPVMRE
jgi:hypothetical protein